MAASRILIKIFFFIIIFTILVNKSISGQNLEKHLETPGNVLIEKLETPTTNILNEKKIHEVEPEKTTMVVEPKLFVPSSSQVVPIIPPEQMASDISPTIPIVNEIITEPKIPNGSGSVHITRSSGILPGYPQHFPHHHDHQIPQLPYIHPHSSSHHNNPFLSPWLFNNNPGLNQHNMYHYKRSLPDQSNKVGPSSMKLEYPKRPRISDKFHYPALPQEYWSKHKKPEVPIVEDENLYPPQFIKQFSPTKLNEI